MESNAQQKSSKAQLPMVKVLQLVQKNFATAGIVPQLASQPYLLNRRVKLGFLTLGLAVSCNFTYTFSEANAFIEYTQSIFMSSLTIIVSFALFSMVIKVNELFKFINDLDDTGSFGERNSNHTCSICYFSVFQN